jgi:hypothetical protein
MLATSSLLLLAAAGALSVQAAAIAKRGYTYICPNAVSNGDTLGATIYDQGDEFDCFYGYVPSAQAYTLVCSYNPVRVSPLPGPRRI